jgi:putative tryptophan/tyrosine transport system substrate-binding protein
VTPARVVVAILLLAGVVAATLGAAAQQPGGLIRIGLLPFGSPSNEYDRSLVEAFRLGLREIGLVENRDVALDVAWTTTEAELALAARDLVSRGARLLIPFGTSASLAAKRQAPTHPILFISVGNPVGIGLVGSLSRPGGNVTGFSDILLDLSGKYVQFAREFSKPQMPIFYLWYRAWGDGENRLRATERATQTVGLPLRASSIDDLTELDDAMAVMKKSGAAVVVVQPSPFTYRHRDRFVLAATKQGLAAIFAFPPAARTGAIVAYGPDYADLCRRAASYVDRILKGTKPADLAVQEPIKLDLIVNMKTAKTLGLTVPESLRLQATEMIE